VCVHARYLSVYTYVNIHMHPVFFLSSDFFFWLKATQSAKWGITGSFWTVSYKFVQKGCGHLLIAILTFTWGLMKRSTEGSW